MHVDAATLALLRLTLIENVGPATIARLLAQAGSPEAALQLSVAEIDATRPKGSRGGASGESIVAGIRHSQSLAEEELARADKHRIRLVGIHDPGYPQLLREIPDAPPILYYKGSLDAVAGPSPGFGVGIVGSRSCTTYGLEQTTRFAAALARSGLVIVSGGARGIDTAAHRAALMHQGRTVAVMGCGLGHTYPPENQELFERICTPIGNAADPEAPGGIPGAIVSELPIDTPPDSRNFPRRNRIISGLSLGVLVIEAARKSGALITAKIAAEEHGREVCVVPGRVDSPSSEGSNDLLKAGGAAFVTEPGDVIALLQSAARHQHAGTHAARFQPLVDTNNTLFGSAPNRRAASRGQTPTDTPDVTPVSIGNPEQVKILAALEIERTADELAAAVGLDIVKLRSQLTLLEIAGRVRRHGSRFARVR
ncbi:MAG TPA: DNA-processing protein DprA [Phycisphaerales bacterium]